MTDTVKSWIEERRAIHAAAPGKWKKYLTTHSSGGVIVEDENEEMLFYDAGFGVTVAEPDNAIAIVDAHNMFPRALDALSKVLEVCDKALAVKVEGSSEGEVAMAAMAATVKRAIEGAIND